MQILIWIILRPSYKWSLIAFWSLIGSKNEDLGKYSINQKDKIYINTYKYTRTKYYITWVSEIASDFLLPSEKHKKAISKRGLLASIIKNRIYKTYICNNT